MQVRIPLAVSTERSAVYPVIFPLRFPSSMFAFRKPNLVSPLANVSFRPKKRTLTLGEVCFFVGMTDRLGSVRLADAGSHTACGIYGAQRSIPCHFSAQIPVFDVCLPQTESCFAFGECVIPTKKVVSFWYDFFYPNRRFGISSRFSVHLISSFGAVYHHGIAVHTLSCGLMICNTLCWWYTISTKLMIYKALALILQQKWRLAGIVFALARLFYI